MRLAGAVALVTGASSGVGRATAHRLAARGATVVAHGRDEAALREVSAHTIAIDLSTDGAAAKLAEQALAVAGRVDILVANAGSGYAGELSTMEAESIAPMVAANLTAPIELTRALLPSMLTSRGGTLVYVSSIAGRTGVAGEAVYSATKAGLDTFAESLRFELAGSGVTVGVLVPGVVATQFFERRGRPYGRSRPRLQTADAAAAKVIRLIETGAAETYLPRWLRLPVTIRAVAPRVYRGLAGRFGSS